MAAKKTGEPGWTWRRSVLIGVIAVSFWLLWVIIQGPDNRTNETLGIGLIWSIFGAALIYAGFATVQDLTAIIITRSALPYSDKSSPSEPTPGTPAAPDAPKEE